VFPAGDQYSNGKFHGSKSSPCGFTFWRRLTCGCSVLPLPPLLTPGLHALHSNQVTGSSYLETQCTKILARINQLQSGHLEYDLLGRNSVRWGSILLNHVQIIGESFIQITRYHGHLSDRNRGQIHLCFTPAGLGAHQYRFLSELYRINK